MPNSAERLTTQIQDQIQRSEETAARTGLRVKRLLIQLVKTKLPLLPQYPYSGNVQGITLGDSFREGILILNKDGIFKAPRYGDEYGNHWVAWNELVEIKTSDYLRYASTAISLINYSAEKELPSTWEGLA